MQRQKSITSFFKKPSPEGHPKTPGGDSADGGGALPLPLTKQDTNDAVSGPKKATGTAEVDCTGEEVKGTVTPPEKVPRQVLPARGDVIGTNDLFSCIKHKFVKNDTAKISSTGKPTGDPIDMRAVSSTSSVPKQSVNGNFLFQGTRKQTGCLSYGTVKRGSEWCPAVIESDDDVAGPETPGTRPSAPRYKRVQEDILEPKTDASTSNHAKRMKCFQELNQKKNHEEDTAMSSKFEWLHPSKIKDAKGRRPGNPLYDKRTLYIPPDALKKMSASQKQYWDVKCQYMDVVLFFKVGKFYELYEIDAEIGHKELDWKMTVSGVGKCRQVGISESGIDDAVQKLIDRGYKVGRIEQLETSEQAKSRGSTAVIQRKLVSVLTPSTTSDDSIGPNAVHLLAIKEECCALENGSVDFAFAFVDCAALRFWVGSIRDDASYAALGALLMQVSPKEVIYDSQGVSKEVLKALKKYSLTGSSATLLTPAEVSGDLVTASDVKKFIQLKGYFKGSCSRWDHMLEGIMHQDLALCALGGLISHLSRLMLDDALCNGDVISYQVYKGCLRMDGQTLVNLEIFNNNADGGQSGTLYKYLDNCITSFGKRLLRNWICHPLRDVEKINQRLDVVDELLAHPEVMLLVAQYLRKVPDLERLHGRVKATINSSAVLLLPLVGSKTLKQRVKAFGLLVKGLRAGMDLLMSLQNEGHITTSLSKVLCLPQLIGANGLDKFLTQFEAAIDSDFPNYQDHVATDSSAETLSILVELFVEKSIQWSQVIHALSCLDILRSFAVSSSFSCGAMCRPKIFPHSNTNAETGGPILSMKGLWHPYALGASGGLPVPNDLHLGVNEDIYNPCTLLLTGPNMGGKSTLLRATCLAVILAQLGCYVPCETCVLSLVDIVFTRLGATDRIMTGESTFYIECTETAAVLQNATQDSLVLLDELGRGTSTFDGYAIAYAVLRHLVETVNCRLLFATHYHPLTKEFGSHPRVILKHMACAFKKLSESSCLGEQELVFLYRLASGPCPESYGMQVARMAGIPEVVVLGASQAGQVMKKLIRDSFQSSEQRANFSTLHEQWFRSLLAIAKAEETDVEDTFDTLYCLWLELKNSKRLGTAEHI
ncbi:OLC1v1037275C1 [Oldenlandia corymbosa var. corymbosa]|uniref:OLC1v1037275C1 n=1 Tax=Oldenlandia corymbosa var. corymbosa TaxID=529605 RepID=A0AAV1D0Z7_OLDCO|nr:OLC1v1037275C1 [Oldenlandia corymbosa var. corymbosa]